MYHPTTSSLHVDAYSSHHMIAVLHGAPKEYVIYPPHERHLVYYDSYRQAFPTQVAELSTRLRTEDDG